MRKFLLFTLAIAIGNIICAQEPAEEKPRNWSYHFQTTVIAQKHSAFKSPYIGENSLVDTIEPTAISLTSTIFLGRKLWKGASIYFNPEMSGGKGLSFTKGVAGALNGETYRVGATEPQVFIARAYFQQHFRLGNSEDELIEDDFNQVQEKAPSTRITFTAGKFAIADFFDDNSYCKDPRTQFFNWSMWANGAWDYPADTRGYTYGVIVDLRKPTWGLKFSSVAVPRIANFHLLEYKLFDAHSETLEFDRQYKINSRPGAFRVIASYTRSKAPSYDQGLEALNTNNAFLLDVISGNEENTSYRGKKFGIGFNIEQELSNDIGFFSRIGWNDGKYVSWAFTEIDQTFNAGVSVKGLRWHRQDDVLGIGFAVNGISSGHREFLKKGGYGFIIGDGQLNYAPETIVESFYNAKLLPFAWLTFDYQFVAQPGHNKDRGPVHVFALRLHIEI